MRVGVVQSSFDLSRFVNLHQFSSDFWQLRNQEHLLQFSDAWLQVEFYQSLSSLRTLLLEPRPPDLKGLISAKYQNEKKD